MAQALVLSPITHGLDCLSLGSDEKPSVGHYEEITPNSGINQVSLPPKADQKGQENEVDEFSDARSSLTSDSPDESRESENPGQAEQVVSRPQKLYTMEDVASRKTPEEMWLVIDNEVYDVTEFHREHPGGAKSKYHTTFTSCEPQKRGRFFNFIFSPPNVSTTTVMKTAVGKDATKKFDRYHRRALLGQYKPALRIGRIVADTTEQPKHRRGILGRFGFGS